MTLEQFILYVVLFFIGIFLYTRIRKRAYNRGKLKEYTSSLKAISARVPFIPVKESYTVDEIIVFISFPQPYQDRYDKALIDMVMNELYDDSEHQHIKDALKESNDNPRTACGILILGKNKIKKTFPVERKDGVQSDELQSNWQVWLDMAREDYRDVLGQFPMGFKDRVDALRGVYGDDIDGA